MPSTRCFSCSLTSSWAISASESSTFTSVVVAATVSTIAGTIKAWPEFTIPETNLVSNPGALTVSWKGPGQRELLLRGQRRGIGYIGGVKVREDAKYALLLLLFNLLLSNFSFREYDL